MLEGHGVVVDFEVVDVAVEGERHCGIETTKLNNVRSCRSNSLCVGYTSNKRLIHIEGAQSICLKNKGYKIPRICGDTR